MLALTESAFNALAALTFAFFTLVLLAVGRPPEPLPHPSADFGGHMTIHFAEPPIVEDGADTVQKIVDDAWADTDVVTLTWLGEADLVAADEVHLPQAAPVTGAVVVIKGDEATRAFAAWAESRGYLTRGQVIPRVNRAAAVAAPGVN